MITVDLGKFIFLIYLIYSEIELDISIFSQILGEVSEV